MIHPTLIFGQTRSGRRVDFRRIVRQSETLGGFRYVKSMPFDRGRWKLSDLEIALELRSYECISINCRAPFFSCLSFHFRSGIPFTHLEHDLNTTTFWSFSILVVNIVLFIASTLAFIVISQTYLRQYTIRVLLLAATIIACKLAISQFRVALTNILFFGDAVYRISSVAPIAISLFPLGKHLRGKSVKTNQAVGFGPSPNPV